MTFSLIASDPGVTGGLVHTVGGDIQSWYSIKRVGKRVAVQPIFEWMDSCLPVDVFIGEKVWAQPCDSPTTAWAFGGAEQVVVAIADLLGIQTEFVTPQMWQKGILQGRPTGTRKQRIFETCAFASANFPALIPVLALKKNDGLASAACIAEYGYRLHQHNRL